MLPMRMIPAGPPLWQLLRDQQVRKAQLESEIELCRLQEERKVLEADRVVVQAEIEKMGESPATVRGHARLARWWGSLCVLAVLLTLLSAWWSVSWYLSLGWEKALLAVSVCVLSLIGGMTFLLRARDQGEERHLRRILCALGLGIVLAAAAAGALLGTGRMAGIALLEERQAAAGRATEDLDAESGARDPAVTRAAQTKRLLGLAGFGAVILLTVAGEVASAIAFDEYVKRSTVVRTARPFYQRDEELGTLLVDNARQHEAVSRAPELLYIQLTIAGLNGEQAAADQTAEAQRQAEEEARRARERERYRDSLGFLVKRVLLAFGIGLALILGIAALTLAADRPGVTVVLLDLSRSTEPGEFARNLRATEGVLARLTPGSRLVVLPITEASFQASALMRATAPPDAGRFGEHLDTWRGQSIASWRKTAAILLPSAPGSDLFGALARTAEEFDRGSSRATLIVLSDMRHVGRGFNFERVIKDPLFVLASAERQGLVPRLEGVDVWVLGVHTVGIDERHWRALKAFWTEYFRRAGAELKRFSPNRRLGE